MPLTWRCRRRQTATRSRSRRWRPRWRQKCWSPGEVGAGCVRARAVGRCSPQQWRWRVLRSSPALRPQRLDALAPTASACERAPTTGTWRPGWRRRRGRTCRRRSGRLLCHLSLWRCSLQPCRQRRLRRLLPRGSEQDASAACAAGRRGQGRATRGALRGASEPDNPSTRRETRLQPRSRSHWRFRWRRWSRQSPCRLGASNRAAQRVRPAAWGIVCEQGSLPMRHCSAARHGTHQRQRRPPARSGRRSASLRSREQLHQSRLLRPQALRAPWRDLRTPPPPPLLSGGGARARRCDHPARRDAPRGQTPPRRKRAGTAGRTSNSVRSARICSGGSASRCVGSHGPDDGAAADVQASLHRVSR
jgi:hypothetical protein